MDLNASPHLASRPFGDADCETEVERLQDHYCDYFFSETAFNSSALDPRTYLVIGRRGSGKTALSQYFSFQTRFPDCRSVDVDEPEVFEKIMRSLGQQPGLSNALHVHNIAQMWDVILWSIAFRELADRDRNIARACLFTEDRGPITRFVFKVLDGVLKKCLNIDGSDIATGLQEILHDPVFEQGKAAAVEAARTTPLIIAVDSLEQYEIENEQMMQVTAALVQSAAKFNRRFAHQGIHIKVFLAGEVYPHLVESVITNPLKYAKDPIFLTWRSKDLLRLICWRFHRYLSETESLLPESSETIHWRDHQDVHRKMWAPYFGEEVKNRCGLMEPTFSYVLRHTHLRPRQIIVLCNHIATRAMIHGTFPVFDGSAVTEAVERAELELANEVINSYSSVYPQASLIVNALKGLSPVFKANQLDKTAPKTASLWPGNYSPINFRTLVAQLGIIGRVESQNGPHYSVAFEYSSRDRLAIQSDDECAIHPMFFKRLNVRSEDKIIHPILGEED